MPVTSRRRALILTRLNPSSDEGPQHVIPDELRRVILAGEAPPGTPIPLAEVAQLFGVSAIPVREALKTLVGEGLVAHRPNAGYVVAQLSRGEINELYVVRGVLEAAALRAAVGSASMADVEEARKAVAALEKAILNGDMPAYHRESRRFHLALMAPCRMLRLLGMVESAWNLTEPVQPMRYVDSTARWRLHRDHEGMLAAFAERDTDLLLRLATEHHGRLEGVVQLLPQGAGLAAEPGV